jgi:hypothetical protein
MGGGSAPKERFGGAARSGWTASSMSLEQASPKKLERVAGLVSDALSAARSASSRMRTSGPATAEPQAPVGTSSTSTTI